MSSKAITAAIVGVFIAAGSPAHAGSDPGAVCKEKKAKATGKKASDLLKAFGKNVKKPNATKLGQAVSKAQSKFTKGFTKAESKDGCWTSGDSGTIEAKVDAFVGDVTATMPFFTDNGDGTITHKATSLMWEKKDDNNVGGMRAKNNTYTWSTGGSPWNPDGTAFTVCLDTLNNKCDGDESTPCTTNGDCTGIGNELCGHAGYRDWRIPEVNRDGGAAELETILLAPYPCRPAPFQWTSRIAWKCGRSSPWRDGSGGDSRGNTKLRPSGWSGRAGRASTRSPGRWT
jgi:hypothetical protein